MFQRIGSREAAPVIDVLRNVAQDRDTRQRVMTIEVTGSLVVIITAEQLCYCDRVSGRRFTGHERDASGR